jgi:hypothetical protein
MRLSDAQRVAGRAGLSDDHRRVIETVSRVYRAHRWPRDDKANRAWIADVTARFERIRTRVLPRYSDSKRARLDIVYVGNARGDYTWVYLEVHSMINAADVTYQGWLGVEMTLHEASHGPTDSLTEALDKALRAAIIRRLGRWTARMGRSNRQARRGYLTPRRGRESLSPIQAHFRLNFCEKGAS